MPLGGTPDAGGRETRKQSGTRRGTAARATRQRVVTGGRLLQSSGVTPLDRLIQRLRVRQAGRYLPRGARVLDVGCADGALFRLLGDHLAGGVGIDPDLPAGRALDRFSLVAGTFPDDVPPRPPFDAVTMLAVVEHVERAELERWAEACPRLLRPEGALIVTTPSPSADRVLHGLQRLGLIDGMSLHEHHGFDPDDLPGIFSTGGLELVTRRRFQLGFNNLFVFRRAGPAAR